MHKRNSLEILGVSENLTVGTGGNKSPVGAFFQLGFLVLLKQKKQSGLRSVKNKKRGLKTHCLRGLIGQNLKNGGSGRASNLEQIWSRIPPENRVIGNRHAKNTQKAMLSLITGTQKQGVLTCRH